jgi:hypothetical protein
MASPTWHLLLAPVIAASLALQIGLLLGGGPDVIVPLLMALAIGLCMGRHLPSAPRVPAGRFPRAFARPASDPGSDRPMDATFAAVGASHKIRTPQEAMRCAGRCWP